MALRSYQDAQQNLQGSQVWTYKDGGLDVGPDLTEFLIQTLDPQNGTVKENLTLQGTFLPHQPFERSVSQEIMRYYYPGGQAIREPTVQVLGSMEEDVTLKGEFRATKIRDTDRRTEPLILSDVLDRLVKEGNVCRFTIGSWIKYGVLAEWRPNYHTDSWISWTMRLMIIGDKNPITGAEEEGEAEISRIFGTSDAEDASQISESMLADMFATKTDLENSGYIPRISVQPFSISGYLGKLIEGTAIGDLVDFGRSVYQGWTDIIQAVDAVTSSAVQFSEEIERTAEDIQRQILLITSQISKVYEIQQNLFTAVNRVESGVDTFSRLLAWNTIGDMIAYTHRIQGNFSDLKRSVEREEITNFREIYFVKEGDTLQSISSRFYGNPDRWDEIRQLNNLEVGADLAVDYLLIIPN